MDKILNSSKKLPQYKGELNSQQIVEGIMSAQNNACRLLKSANVLFEHADYPTASSLAILAIEESGKISILRSLSLARDENEIKEDWRRYRSHIAKNVMWSMFKYIHTGKNKLEDFKLIFDANNKDSYELDQIKQLGFYTDCLGNAHWSTPLAIIDKDFAEFILNIAKISCHEGNNITIKEIELWKECMSPVWKQSLANMKKGILMWRHKMREEGLTSKPDHFDDFITAGIEVDCK